MSQSFPAGTFIYLSVAIYGTSDSQPLAHQLQVTLIQTRVHSESARFGASQEVEFLRLYLLFNTFLWDRLYFENKEQGRN